MSLAGNIGACKYFVVKRYSKYETGNIAAGPEHINLNGLNMTESEQLGARTIHSAKTEWL